MLDYTKLYPQYKVINDRRQQNVPVENDRRSGVERRSQDRVQLDTKLTRDIFEIRSKVTPFQRPDASNVSKVAFTQNAEKAVLNTLKTDQFVKSTPDETSSDAKIEPTSNTKSAALAGGVLVSILGGIVVSTFMGPAGICIALGVGSYFGGKLLNQVISTHMRYR